MSKKKTTRILISLSDDSKKKLDQLCMESELSRSAMIRLLISKGY